MYNRSSGRKENVGFTAWMLKHVLGPIEQAFLRHRAKLHAMAKPRLMVAMYCRAGDHRSVGIGELLCAALQQETLVEAPPVLHLCEFLWYRRHCRHCAQCRAHCADTQWAHKQAAEAARPNHDNQCYILWPYISSYLYSRWLRRDLSHWRISLWHCVLCFCISFHSWVW